MKGHVTFLSLVLVALLAAPLHAQRAPDALMLAGEVTQSSAILQGRLSSGTTLVDYDLPGRAGWARWEVSADRTFRNPLRTDWARAEAAGDFLVKNVVTGLKPGTRYHYRLLSGPTREAARPGRVGTFRTLPPANAAVPFGFVMLSCMDYEKFHGLARLEVRADWIQPATGEDKRLGYPALDQIRRLEPAFVIGNGDNVYYDRATPIARTAGEMRAKWHRLFAMPRMRALTDSIATFWLKDDHDYRYNDADTLDAGKAPSHRLGVELFREQLPIVPPGDASAPTYRTYRVNRDLQIWFLEGRDHRSPNALPDDADKTLWGAEQKAWLMRTLEQSDATFRVVVSPTPLVGPDDAYKRDNHVNVGGFSTEGAEFMRWLGERGLMDRVFIMNGDRHWQYHSIHPSGLEEFGSGSVISQNSRFGREPGDSASTDPEARIRQPYIQTHPVGGFLHVQVDPSGATNRPSILFTFRDEAGEVLYAARRYAERTARAAAAAAAHGEEVGEYSIPTVSPLDDAQLARLRALVRDDREGRALAASLADEARPLFDLQPRPLEEIHYEGLVNTDPRRIASVERLRQTADAARLMRFWQASGDPRAAATLRRIVTAWADSYRPTGNDVNENKLYPLLVAYHSLRDGFPADERARVDAWVERLGTLHAAAVQQSTHFTNRYSKHVRLAAIAGLILDRADWSRAAQEGTRRFVTESLFPDGSSLDLKRRDALSYHNSGLRPILELAMLAGEDGRALYSWTSPNGGSLKRSVDYVVPFATGERTRAEWVNTTVELDRRRAAAGLPYYRAGKPFDPQDALRLMEEASYFDADLVPVVRKLTGAGAARFPTWQTLVNEAARPG